VVGREGDQQWDDDGTADTDGHWAPGKGTDGTLAHGGKPGRTDGGAGRRRPAGPARATCSRRAGCRPTGRGALALQGVIRLPLLGARTTALGRRLAGP
jgi:hypothetical protein